MNRVRGLLVAAYWALIAAYWCGVFHCRRSVGRRKARRELAARIRRRTGQRATP